MSYCLCRGRLCGCADMMLNVPTCITLTYGDQIRAFFPKLSLFQGLVDWTIFLTDAIELPFTRRNPKIISASDCDVLRITKSYQETFILYLSQRYVNEREIQGQEVNKYEKERRGRDTRSE